MPWYDFVWRSAILAVTLLVVTRLLGKRMVAELTPIDFVAGITVGTIAGSASIASNVPIWGGVLALAAWATFQAVNAGLAYRLPAYRRLAVGQGVELVRQGQVIRQNLVRTNISPSTLRSELRAKKVSNIHEVRRLVLEPGGKLGLVLRKKRKL
jgi:uncharacterized membrane protein YcaP (DUF421 family)